MKVTKSQLRRIIREALSTEVPDIRPHRKSSFQVRKEKELAAKRKSGGSHPSSHERETGLPSEFVEDNWLPWLDERGLGAEDLDDLARFTGAPDRSWLPAAPPADGMDGPADLELWARHKKTGMKE